jgi:WD40 repeat protein
MIDSPWMHPMTEPRDRTSHVFRFDQNVNDAEWSPDGRWLAIGGSDRRTTVIDGQGSERWHRIENTKAIYRVAWAPDGQRFATASDDNTALIWNAADGQVLRRVTESVPVWDIAWAPDSKQLVYALWSNSRAVVIEATTGVVRWQLTTRNKASSVAWSPDGYRIATGTDDGTLEIWDATTGQRIQSVAAHQRLIRSVAFSPDSKRLATAGWDHLMKVWDVETGRESFRSGTHGGMLREVAWSPDGHYLATCGAERDVHLWEAKHGNRVLILSGHSSNVQSVTFSPVAGLMATGSVDNSLRVWDVSDLVKVRPAPGSTPVNSYALRHAATVGRRPLGVAFNTWLPKLDGADGHCLGIVRPGSVTSNCSVACHPDGHTLILGAADGRLRRLNLFDGNMEWEASHHHSGAVWDVDINPDGQTFASLSDDEIVLWDLATGEVRQRFGSGSGRNLELAWAPDGGKLISGGWGSRVELWETTGVKIRDFVGHSGTVWGLAWSPDGRWIASGADDGVIRIWDALTGETRNNMPGFAGWVGEVGWSPDGRYFAACCYKQHLVTLWDAISWQEIRRCRGHTSSVLSLSWSPDGQYLASGAGQSTDQTIRVWRVSDGAEVRCFSFPEDNAWRITWSKDGRFLISAHLGNVWRIWDTRGLVKFPAATVAAPGKSQPITARLRPLPAQLARLHRMGQFPPLSLVDDLIQLTGGEVHGSLAESLGGHPGIKRLVSLRWPNAARLGLVALLLRDVPLTGWEPPADLAPSDLRPSLLQALHGTTIPPEAPAAPIAALLQAADDIDDRLIGMLTILGPEAVAADPSLPVRLLPRLTAFPRLTAHHREILARGFGPTDTGSALAGGRGAERSGIDTHGDWPQLLPSQWNLPGSILSYKQRTGGLLYRARPQRPAPRARPLVVMLDISPACIGPIGTATRIAAHVAISGAMQAGLPSVFIACAEHDRVFEVKSPEDMIEIWLNRGMGQPAVERSMRLASRLRAGLSQHGEVPAVLLLSHSRFGADAENLPTVAGLHGLFVAYPGHRERPVLASACTKWAVVDPNRPIELQNALFGLLE